jgi:hypothetical protein
MVADAGRAERYTHAAFAFSVCETGATTSPEQSHGRTYGQINAAESASARSTHARRPAMRLLINAFSGYNHSMASLTIADKAAALSALYDRITLIVESMGGAVSRVKSSRQFPSQIVPTPRVESVDVLVAQMPESVTVEFSPFYPLGVPGVLNVQVRCAKGGLRKNDAVGFNFGPDGWRKGNDPMTDDDIRACLKVDGLMPAVY